MIPCALLIYVGAVLNAPWWYYVLLGVYAIAQIVKYTVKLMKVGKNGE